ncbi:hypothetical protein MLD52_21665, partial [Puniceicoccaceae bacterium K14]|nr:hypothetical protein [Puniceicoccaceae bacterium K14]
MKRSIIKTSACALTAALLGGTSMFGISWDGGGADNNFATPENWDTDVAPTAGDSVEISGDVTVLVSDESGTIAFDRMTVLNGGATLDITGGDLNTTQSGNNIADIIGQGSTGNVNVTGGLYRPAHRLAIGGSAGSDATVTVDGGALQVGRAGTSQVPGTEGNSSVDVGAADGPGALNLISGEFRTRLGLAVGAMGTLYVEGTGMTQIGVGSHNNGDGFWHQAAGGILKVGIEADGLTPILVDDVDDDGANAQGNATFEDGAILDVGFADGVDPVDGTWVVMQVEGAINDSGLALTQEDIDAGWSLEFSDTGVNGTTQGEGDDTLSVTYAGAGGVVDTDNDGVGDDSDAFPTDPAEWFDFDMDGTGNNSDERQELDGADLVVDFTEG